MADNSVVDNDPVVVEDQAVDVDNNDQSVSNRSSNNNSKYVMIAISIIASVIIYFFIFSSNNKEDSIDANQIVRDDSREQSTPSGVIDNIDNIVSMDYNSNSDNQYDNREILELPELPKLPDNITQDIEQEIKEVKKQSVPDNVFTKEEVDEMIGMKLKGFEAEMNKIKNESERLAKELEKKNQEEELEKKKKKFASVLDNKSPITPPTNEMPSDVSGGLPPSVVGSGDEIMSAEERKKEEEKQLAIAQRKRIMQERRGSSMFKMQGSGGGGDGKDAEKDSIIILDKDSLENIQEVQTEVVTTKTADMSRTITQGKIIAAVLENAINTDVKNQVRAVVSRDVYSESGKNILIPKGSRVIGSYQTVTSTTVARLDIVWSRIIRTDGLSIGISSNTADNMGRGGVEGDLDNKYTQIIRNAFLSSVVSIATAALVDKITDTVTTTSTSGTTTTTTSNATNQAIIDATEDFSDELKSITDNLKEEKPTIRISQGTKINIVVNQDLVLPIFKQKGKYDRL